MVKRNAPDHALKLKRRAEWDIYLEFLRMLFNLTDRLSILHMPIQEQSHFMDNLVDAVTLQLKAVLEPAFGPNSDQMEITLAIGNSEVRLREILATSRGVDLFFYDNGPVATRARFELRAAWDALSDRGILLAHHVDANSAWADFCRLQGLPPQLLDVGPPPLGALALSTRGPERAGP
jgi:hypothetical protein